MGLQSMTGFARSQIDTENISISWEIRSVNSRGLDIRIRTPQGQDSIERLARAALQKAFTRGSINATLTIAENGVAALPAINETVLAEYTAVAMRMHKEFGTALPSADGLMALKGVVEAPDMKLEQEVIEALALKGLEQAKQSLRISRLEEGAALRQTLEGHAASIEVLTQEVEADPSLTIGAIQARLTAQVLQLLESSSQLDETRLHQEAALLATKADIREEVDRLKMHVASARELLASGSAVGRRLDFLAQEFNREANTLCSKANAASVTAIGLKLKVVIDQMREQVQNLE